MGNIIESEMYNRLSDTSRALLDNSDYLSSISEGEKDYLLKDARTVMGLDMFNSQYDVTVRTYLEQREKLLAICYYPDKFKYLNAYHVESRIPRDYLKTKENILYNINTLQLKDIGEKICKAIYSEDILQIFLPLNEMYWDGSPYVTLEKSMYVFGVQTNILDAILEKSSRFSI